MLGLGTTGYGEQMLSAKPFTPTTTRWRPWPTPGAAAAFFPDATFLLDIGGQDMKAIWLKDGVVTNIMLNEACSSGCGSFLENFASTLGMPVDQVADAAFRSQAPAELGSRCTVFMNSTIINEQRNGKQPDDLMAGLCRSIIENVFTKVVRIANVAELGDTGGGPGGHLPELRRAAGPGGVSGPGGDPGPLSRRDGRSGCGSRGEAGGGGPRLRQRPLLRLHRL